MLHLWKKFQKMFAKDKKNKKLTDHCHFKGKYT